MRMDVFQCPECELRFRNASELESHVATDHPEFHIEWKAAGGTVAEAHRRLHRKRHYGSSN